MTLKCDICGAEFERRQSNQRYCSAKCAKVAAKRKYRQQYRDCYKALVSDAHFCARLVGNQAIMVAPRRPKGVSAVRWRIELRRRLNPEHYALAEKI